MYARIERWRLALVAAGFALIGMAAGALPGREPPRQTGRGHVALPAAAVAWELMGGLRTPGADLAWLRMHEAWNRREPRTTLAWLRTAVELNPQSLFFLVQGARILAYDLPAWRVAAEPMPQVAAERIRQAGARQALALLDAGADRHADNPLWWIERANIALQAAADMELAADNYRRAALLPGAPPYAARLHAHLLVKLGRPEEAHAWLVQLHPGLPADDAQADRVLALIRGLEERLGLAEDQRYRCP